MSEPSSTAERVRMVSFQSEPEELIREEVMAFERVRRSGWYVLGSEVEAFERKWAEACGCRSAVGTGNGMDAIEIGLRAVSIGAGDEVITTPMTAFATVLAIVRAGATPVLADIDPDTAILDPESVERCITGRTRGVLLVHLYGRLPEMDRWVDLARRHDILLLEDCAQAHGASWQGKAAGSFGVWGAYSFYPTKNLGAIGDAGALVTDDAEIAASARTLRNYGQSERYHHPQVGMNSRLDEVQAALLDVRMEWLPRFTERRKKVAATYRARIRNSQVALLPPEADPSQEVHHLFVVTSERRDALAAHLAGRGIDTLIHYPVPVHEQRPFLDVGRDPQGLRNAERHARSCLSLPCHPFLTDADLELVIDAVNDFR